MRKLALILPFLASVALAVPPSPQSMGKIGVKSITFGDGTIQTSAASGGGGGVYPATTTASFPFGLSASTITVSTMSVGDVMFEKNYDSTSGTPMYTLIIEPQFDNARAIRVLFPDGTNAMTLDAQNKRWGFFTTTPASGMELNSNVKIDGTARIESGIRIPTTAGAFSFQGTATLASGSAVVTNAIIDNTWSIYLTNQSPSGTVGALYVSSITANTTFNVLSTNAGDNSTFSWLMVQH